MLEVSATDGGAMWISYVGPLGAKPRTIKLDISDDELVENLRRLTMLSRWSDLPADAAIDGYTLDEVGAEKLRCIAERLQCRDFFDLHGLLHGQHPHRLTSAERVFHDRGGLTGPYDDNPP